MSSVATPNAAGGSESETARSDARPVRVAPAAFRWSVFPVVMGGAVAATLYAIHTGVDPSLAIIGPQFAAIVVVAILEHVYPYHRSWNRNRKDVHVDAAHGVVLTTASILVGPPVLALGVAAGAWFSESYGLGLWPTHWPILAQGVLALVIGELPGYWLHRWQHHWDGLWRFHATHHSAPRLYWLNAARFHVGDTLMVLIPTNLLLAGLGCGAEGLAIFVLVTTVHGIFQHANVQLKLGPLNHFFSMAELHRWHHSKTIEEANHNFGQTVILWDTLFGTRFLPKDREPPEDIGIPDLPSFPMGWWQQVLSPFTWKRIRREAERAAGGNAPA